jgi:hypothetical protein
MSMAGPCPCSHAHCQPAHSATTRRKIASPAIIIKGVGRVVVMQEAMLRAVDQGLGARRRGSSITVDLMPVRYPSTGILLAGMEPGHSTTVDLMPVRSLN